MSSQLGNLTNRQSKQKNNPLRAISRPRDPNRHMAATRRPNNHKNKARIAIRLLSKWRNSLPIVVSRQHPEAQKAQRPLPEEGRRQVPEVVVGLRTLASALRVPER